MTERQAQPLRTRVEVGVEVKAEKTVVKSGASALGVGCSVLFANAGEDQKDGANCRQVMKVKLDSREA